MPSFKTLVLDQDALHSVPWPVLLLSKGLHDMQYSHQLLPTRCC